MRCLCKATPPVSCVFCVFLRLFGGLLPSVHGAHVLRHAHIIFPLRQHKTNNFVRNASGHKQAACSALCSKAGLHVRVVDGVLDTYVCYVTSRSTQCSEGLSTLSGPVSTLTFFVTVRQQI